MSLGGLAVALGTVVDASIVVCENIARHLAEKSGRVLSRVEIAYEAVREVVQPVVFAILIIVISKLPLFTLQQMEGKMFRPLAFTMVYAMAGSLLVALTIVPVLSSLFLRAGKEDRDSLVMRLVKRGYLPALNFALRRSKTVVVFAIGVLAVTVLLVPRVGTEFLPQLDEGAIAINVVRLPSASLDGSVAVGTEIERRLLARFPEVRTVVTKTGRAEISEDPMGPEQNDVIIMLHPKEEWKSKRSKAALVAAMQAELAVIPGIRMSFSQPIALRVNELISGVKSDLAVKIFGPDLDRLKEVADRAAALMGGIPGAADIKVEQVAGMSQLDAVIDREAAARHGIDVGLINETIETAAAGRLATTLIEEDRRVAVVVRYPESARRDVTELERLLVPAPGGERVPLGQLATFKLVEAPAQVTRENGMRRVVVEANVRGRDLGGFVNDVRAAVGPLGKDLPPGYRIEYGGQFENQQRAMHQLSIVVPIALLLIMILLHLALGSFRHAFLVLLNLPFALVGGVVAVVAFGMPLSVSAAVAFIVLLGVAVQNGVVLVAFFRQLSDEGAGINETITRGCDLRFRPLLMTALTSFIGHVPMLFATGSGADIQKPLAVVVMGGLITSTLLTLVVLPVLYGWVEERREQAAR
jgi:cobalt-zinc-cadmium resistance protein CzcA